MVKKASAGQWLFDFLVAAFFAALSALFLYPLIYEIAVSFSDAGALFRHRGLLFYPLDFTVQAYQIVLKNQYVASGFQNTLFVLIIGLAFNLILTSIGAYFLSRKGVLLFRPIMLYILTTMYFSGGLIPFWLTVRNLGLYDSLWSLILPTAISTYNMILLRSYFQTIPDALTESVKIDGGGHLVTLFRIVMPLSLPAMAVMVLYYGVGHWNSWFNANIFLRTKALFPLQLIMRNMLINGTDLDVDSGTAGYEQIVETVKAAMVIITTLPILIIYPFLQKYFVSGIMIGSLKE